MIKAVYADGGMIAASRSAIGGSWAFCFVDENGEHVLERSGTLRPPVGYDSVTNNMMEYYALLHALCLLPDGWSGPVYTDSLCTIQRVCKKSPEEEIIGLPSMWVWSMRKQIARLGKLTLILLDGHPTKEQLASGTGKRGNPVSIHNAWCDEECNRVKAQLLANPSAHSVGANVHSGSQRLPIAQGTR